MPKFLSQIDFSAIPTKSFVVEQLSAAPGSPTNGRIYYDTVLNVVRVYQNGAWVNFGAQLVTSVAGKTGAVTLVKADVGLSNVDNTSDLNKPISTATQTALNGKANLNHNQDISTIVGAGSNSDYVVRTNGSGGVVVEAGYSWLSNVLSASYVDLGNTIGFRNAADPSLPGHFATKNYVDNMVQGLSPKESTHVATTANITLSGTQTIDGVAVVAGDRVLVKNQLAPRENGIYVVAAGAWVRSSDADSWNDLIGAFVFVEEGTTQQDTAWLCTVDAGGTLGTTVVDWVQFSGAADIIPGQGLIKVGNTISVGNNSITNAMLADGAVNLATADVTGTLPVANGGTGSNNATQARKNLGTLSVLKLTSPALSAGVWTTISSFGIYSSDSIITARMSPNPWEDVYIDYRYDYVNIRWEVKVDMTLAAGALELRITGKES